MGRELEKIVDRQDRLDRPSDRFDRSDGRGRGPQLPAAFQADGERLGRASSSILYFILCFIERNMPLVALRRRHFPSPDHPPGNPLQSSSTLY